jgi:histidyl-tRNA synthetase
MLDALSQLDFLPPFRLQVNNRRLIQGFYTGLGITDVDEVMRVIDKLDKLPAAAVRSLLIEEVGLLAEQADRCLALADICTPDEGFVAQVRALGVEHPLLDAGLAELAELVRGCAPLVTDRVTIVADLKIARGLDYYTGTVFETRLEGSESLGSICSGGRYDALASDGRTTYPGVGISLGVSRLLVPLLNRGVLDASRSVPSAVLVALVDEESRPASDAIAASLRANGVPCEVAASAQKFGKQIRYAERRGIPYVWFTNAEGGHEVKDIRSGEQTAADPAAWSPPAEDLRPSVVSTGSTTEDTRSTQPTGDRTGRPATKEQHQ